LPNAIKNRPNGEILPHLVTLNDRNMTAAMTANFLTLKFAGENRRNLSSNGFGVPQMSNQKFKKARHFYLKMSIL
jgi:hypothetical protein